MAVALDATGTLQITNAATSASYTGMTVGASLSNGALIICCSFGNSGSTPVSALTAVWVQAGANQTMTKIIQTDHADGAAMQTTVLFGLVNPASGNKTLTLSWTGTADVYVEGISFTGVDQTGGATSFAHSAGATGSSTGPTVNITCPAGDYTVACCASQNGSSSIAYNGSTQLYASGGAANFGWGAGGYTTGAGTNSPTFTLGVSDGWSVSGVDVVAAGGGGVTLGNPMQLIMM